MVSLNASNSAPSQQSFANMLHLSDKGTTKRATMCDFGFGFLTEIVAQGNKNWKGGGR